MPKKLFLSNETVIRYFGRKEINDKKTTTTYYRLFEHVALYAAAVPSAVVCLSDRSCSRGTGRHRSGIWRSAGSGWLYGEAIRSSSAAFASTNCSQTGCRSFGQQSDDPGGRRIAGADRLQREREEQARLEEERKAREAAEAAERAKQAEAIAKANALGSLFGNNGSDAQGSGDSQGQGQKGNPVGHGSSGGNNWTIGGNRHLIGELPAPSYNHQENAVVVVRIRVNSAGNVIEATEWKGTNTGNKNIIESAKTAARKTKWSEGTNDQYGYITYTFKVR